MSCPVKKQKPPPDLKRPSNAIALRANLVEVRLFVLCTQRVGGSTSDCGTFYPGASSNVSFAPAFIPFIKRELYVAMRLPYNIHELPSAQQCLRARRDIRASFTGRIANPAGGTNQHCGRIFELRTALTASR